MKYYLDALDKRAPRGCEVGRTYTMRGSDLCANGFCVGQMSDLMNSDAMWSPYRYYEVSIRGGAFYTGRWGDVFAQQVTILREITLKEMVSHNGGEPIPVYVRGKGCNFGNIEGKYISPIWFCYVGSAFREGFAQVKLYHRWNCINKEGALLSDVWYDFVHNFHDGCAEVHNNGKRNFINTSGNLISDTWFDDVRTSADYMCVELDGKENIIDNTGRYLFDVWYNRILFLTNGYLLVLSKGAKHTIYNIADNKGNFLSETWRDYTTDYHGEYFEFAIRFYGKYKPIGKTSKK